MTERWGACGDSQVELGASISKEAGESRAGKEVGGTKYLSIRLHYRGS